MPVPTSTTVKHRDQQQQQNKDKGLPPLPSPKPNLKMHDTSSIHSTLTTGSNPRRRANTMDSSLKTLSQPPNNLFLQHSGSRMSLSSFASSNPSSYRPLDHHQSPTATTTSYYMVNGVPLPTMIMFPPKISKKASSSGNFPILQPRDSASVFSVASTTKAPPSTAPALLNGKHYENRDSNKWKRTTIGVFPPAVSASSDTLPDNVTLDKSKPVISTVSIPPIKGPPAFKATESKSKVSLINTSLPTSKNSNYSLDIDIPEVTLRPQKPNAETNKWKRATVGSFPTSVNPPQSSGNLSSNFADERTLDFKATHSKRNSVAFGDLPTFSTRNKSDNAFVSSRLVNSEYPSVKKSPLKKSPPCINLALPGIAKSPKKGKPIVSTFKAKKLDPEDEQFDFLADVSDGLDDDEPGLAERFKNLPMLPSLEVSRKLKEEQLLHESTPKPEEEPKPTDEAMGSPIATFSINSPSSANITNHESSDDMYSFSMNVSEAEPEPVEPVRLPVPNTDEIDNMTQGNEADPLVETNGDSNKSNFELKSFKRGTLDGNLQAQLEAILRETQTKKKSPKKTVIDENRKKIEGLTNLPLFATPLDNTKVLAGPAAYPSNLDDSPKPINAATVEQNETRTPVGPVVNVFIDDSNDASSPSSFSPSPNSQLKAKDTKYLFPTSPQKGRQLSPLFEIESIDEPDVPTKGGDDSTDGMDNRFIIKNRKPKTQLVVQKHKHSDIHAIHTDDNTRNKDDQEQQKHQQQSVFHPPMVISPNKVYPNPNTSELETSPALVQPFPRGSFRPFGQNHHPYAPSNISCNHQVPVSLNQRPFNSQSPGMESNRELSSVPVTNVFDKSLAPLPPIPGQITLQHEQQLHGHAPKKSIASNESEKTRDLNSGPGSLLHEDIQSSSSSSRSSSEDLERALQSVSTIMFPNIPDFIGEIGKNTNMDEEEVSLMGDASVMSVAVTDRERRNFSYEVDCESVSPASKGFSFVSSFKARDREDSSNRLRAAASPVGKPIDEQDDNDDEWVDVDGDEEDEVLDVEGEDEKPDIVEDEGNDTEEIVDLGLGIRKIRGSSRKQSSAAPEPLPSKVSMQLRKLSFDGSDVSNSRKGSYSADMGLGMRRAFSFSGVSSNSSSRHVSYSNIPSPQEHNNNIVQQPRQISIAKVLESRKVSTGAFSVKSRQMSNYSIASETNPYMFMDVIYDDYIKQRQASMASAYSYMPRSASSNTLPQSSSQFELSQQSAPPLPLTATTNSQSAFGNPQIPVPQERFFSNSSTSGILKNFIPGHHKAQSVSVAEPIFSQKYHDTSILDVYNEDESFADGPAIGTQ
ncbi:unnamed protein product [Ambrosiozyma monospora]|uniref:Unnamed protein product n=1 Tax=Ambrosiozyma monospora TaxID=43982 RepID=A0A9W6YTW9_AMBMO|nr:unnamed protein product [Ambrosiozyma monospora]